MSRQTASALVAAILALLIAALLGGFTTLLLKVGYWWLVHNKGPPMSWPETLFEAWGGVTCILNGIIGFLNGRWFPCKNAGELFVVPFLLLVIAVLGPSWPGGPDPLVLGLLLSILAVVTWLAARLAQEIGACSLGWYCRPPSNECEVRDHRAWIKPS
jgi:hypothetical protein